ncbi:hypothetical protein [Dubosiella newyorkensis]|nr:hypothetical protein [Dubosiella newyorkensis]
MKKIKQQEIMQRYIASRSRDIYIYGVFPLTQTQRKARSKRSHSPQS